MVTRRQVLITPISLMVMGASQSVLGSTADKDTVRIGLSLAPSSLDPTSTAEIVVAQVLHYNVLEGLVQLDEKGNVEPCLAREWQISDDGRTQSSQRRRWMRTMWMR